MDSRYYKSDFIITLRNVPGDYDYFIAKFYDAEGHTIVVGVDPNSHSGETLSLTSSMTIEGDTATVFINNHNFVVGVVKCQFKIGRLLDGEIYDSVTGKFPIVELYDEKKPNRHNRNIEHLLRVNYENNGVDHVVPFRYSHNLFLNEIMKKGCSILPTLQNLRDLGLSSNPHYAICIEKSRMYHYDANSTASDDGTTVIAPSVGNGRWLSVFSFLASNITDTDINHWNYAYNNYDNVIDEICLNGTPLVPANKSVNISVKENVQANWNQNDTTKDDYIKNKPNNLVTTGDIAGFVSKILVGDSEYTPVSGVLTLDLSGFIMGVNVDNTPLVPSDGVVNIDLASKIENVRFNGTDATVSGKKAVVNYTPQVAELGLTGLVEQGSSTIDDPSKFLMFGFIEGEWRYFTISKLKEILNNLY